MATIARSSDAAVASRGSRRPFRSAPSPRTAVKHSPLDRVEDHAHGEPVLVLERDAHGPGREARRGSSRCRRAGRRSSAGRCARLAREPSSPSRPSSGRSADEQLADRPLGLAVGVRDRVGGARTSTRAPPAARPKYDISTSPAARAARSASSRSALTERAHEQHERRRPRAATTAT